MGCLSFDASVKIHQSGKYTSTKTSKSGNGGLYGYIRHIDRVTDKKNGCEVQHSNENIDADYTLENESYFKNEFGNWEEAKTSKDMVQAVNRRIRYAKEHGARIYNGGRNDTTIVRPLLIQLDEETLSKHEDTWMEDTVDLLEEKFGKDNIVGICVHRDETSVHMHVLFTPVFESTDKKGNLKCSVSQTKFFTSPKALAEMHKDIRRSLRDKGYDIEQENKPIEEMLAGYTDKDGIWHQQGLTPEQLNDLTKRKQKLKLEEVDMKLKKEELAKMERSLEETRRKIEAVAKKMEEEKEQLKLERNSQQITFRQQQEDVSAEKEQVERLRAEAEEMLALAYTTSNTCSEILKNNNDDDFLEFCKRYDAQNNKRTYDIIRAMQTKYELSLDTTLTPLERVMKEQQRKNPSSVTRYYGDGSMRVIRNEGYRDSQYV